MLCHEHSEGAIPGVRHFVQVTYSIYTKELTNFNGISVCGIRSVRALHRCPEGSTFQVYVYVVTNMFSAELTKTQQSHVDPSNFMC